MRSFNKNYNKTLSSKLESNPPAEEWGDIISETAMYPFLKNDTLLNKAFSDNYKDNKLLVSLLRALYNPLSEEVSLELFSDFGYYLKKNYPNIVFLNPIGKWRFGNNPKIKAIVAWYYKQVFEPFILECSECAGIMSPSFLKSARYCCINSQCKAYNIPIYENHCWQCLDDVSSLTDYECQTCTWIICSKCSSCVDPRFGICDAQIPIKTKIIEPVPVIDFSNNKFIFNSKMIDRLYQNSLNIFKSINNNNMSAINCNRGKEIIIDEESLVNYMALYLPMHMAKLYDLFAGIDLSNYYNKNVTLYDWGCGQAMGSIALLEYVENILKEQINLEKIVLIEPSELALKRAAELIKQTNSYKECKPEIVLINKEINSINENDINPQSKMSINIFSNILDVTDENKANVVDLDLLNGKIKQVMKNSLFVCISPNYAASRQNIDYFVDSFGDKFDEVLYFNDKNFKVESFDFYSRKMRKRRFTRYAKAFFVE